jgi:2-C-methyl-D-erythritol 4-phosphate cytidylyltransferase
MFEGQKVAAIIVAAGASRRMAGRDKLLAELGGKPLLVSTLNAFVNSPLVDEVVLVVSDPNLEHMKALCKQYKLEKVGSVVSGGARRQDSVAAGLREVAGGWVLIHDGARPLITAQLITAVLSAAVATGAAVPALPVIDTIKQTEGHRVVRTLDRHNLYNIQTPQAFRYEILQQAYRVSEIEATDDAQLVEQAGVTVSLCEGSYDNIKVTTPLDLDLARLLLNKRGGKQ